MSIASLDEELKKTAVYKQRSLPKLLTMLKRHVDTWAEGCLHKHGYTDFKMMFMPLLMNIDPEGTTNTELAKRAHITKQAMSKVVRELEELGYIESLPNKQDRRSSTIVLTKLGKQLVVEARIKVGELAEFYAASVGEKKYNEMIDTLMLLLNYHESGGALPK